MWAALPFGALAALQAWSLVHDLHYGQVTIGRFGHDRSEAPVDYWISIATVLLMACIFGLLALVFATGRSAAGHPQIECLAALSAGFLALDVVRMLRSGDVGRYGFNRAKSPAVFLAMTAMSAFGALVFAAYAVWAFAGVWI